MRPNPLLSKEEADRLREGIQRQLSMGDTRFVVDPFDSEATIAFRSMMIGFLGGIAFSAVLFLAWWLTP